MDIILNTHFNNPALPNANPPGFWDDFDRPEADTLGETSSGRPWEVYSYLTSSSTWGTTGNGTATMKSASAYFHLAVVESGQSEGTLTAELSSIDLASNRRLGIALLAADANNYVAVAPTSPTDHRIRVQQRINGSASNLGGASSAEMGPGDVISATVSGGNLIVNYNGGHLMTVTPDSSLLPNTRHGFYAFTGAVGEWGAVEFEVL